MRILIPSTGGHETLIASIELRSAKEWPITILDCIEGKGAGFLQKLQKGYEESMEDILCYFHSDVTLFEDDWDLRVMDSFEDPKVGIVGFGGGKRLGHPDIYKIGYDFRQLARYDFVSNLKDAEKHGRRNRNEEDIAVVDSFCLIIRRSLLDHTKGWPVDTYAPMHMSDAWGCLLAKRSGLRTRMVGIACEHRSGGVQGNGTFDYGAWQKEIGMTDAEMHTKNHRVLYEMFRPELPVIVR